MLLVYFFENEKNTTSVIYFKNSTIFDEVFMLSKGTFYVSVCLDKRWSKVADFIQEITTLLWTLHWGKFEYVERCFFVYIYKTKVHSNIRPLELVFKSSSIVNLNFSCLSHISCEVNPGPSNHWPVRFRSRLSQFWGKKSNISQQIVEIRWKIQCWCYMMLRRWVPAQGWFLISHQRLLQAVGWFLMSHKMFVQA